MSAKTELKSSAPPQTTTKGRRTAAKPPTQDYQMTEPTAQELYELYCQPGASLRSVGRQVGKSFGWVRNRLVEAGYDLNPVGNPDLEPSEKSMEIVTARVEPEIKEWLRSLPKSESYHVRQALILYKKSLK